MRSYPLVVVLLLAMPCAAKQKKQILAVMPIEDATRSLRPAAVDALTDALRGRLAQSTKFVVIDKSRQAEALKKLVRQQKRASYRSCVDSRCQIPLGQALAAEAILRTRLTRIGSSLHLNAELVDLAKEAVVGGAQSQVPASPPRTREDRLLIAVSVVATQLGGGQVGGGPVGGGPVGGMLHAPGPAAVAGPTTTEEAERARWQVTQQRRQRLVAQRKAARARALRGTQQRRQTRDYRKRRGDRFKVLFYGWSSMAGAALLGGVGTYYLTAKVSSEREAADKATTPGDIKRAVDNVKTAQTTGGVFLGWGVAMAALGAVFLIFAPDAPPEPAKTSSGLEAAPTPGGFAVTYTGRF